MNFHLRPYNQYILNIVTNIYLGLDLKQKKIRKSDVYHILMERLSISVL